MKRIFAALTIFLIAMQLGYAASGTITTTSPYNIVINAPAAAKINVPTSGTLATTGNLNSYLPLAGGTMTGALILSGDPTMSAQAATKNYVDNLAGGLIPVGGTRVATTANLTATYNNGTAGVGATLTNSGTLLPLVIDGVSLATTDRVLVKNQSTPAQNGIYTVSNVGSGVVAWVLTRSIDYDQPTEIKPGTLVSVTSGTVNFGSSWYETATVTTVGTDPVNFSSFFSPAGYLQVANNLSDVASVSTSRTNLGLGTAAVQNVGFFAQTANNLSDLPSPSTARTNLGLGSIATHPTIDFIAAAGTTVVGDLPTFSNTSGNTVQDSTIQAVVYGAINNLFIGTGLSSGNPSITSGARNYAFGGATLQDITSGSDNSAFGWAVLQDTTTGSSNTASGSLAGNTNSTGSFNTVSGVFTWTRATSGDGNTAHGYSALTNLLTGNYNTAYGFQAGINYTSSESSNIDFINPGVIGENNTLHMGTFGTGNGQQNIGYWGNLNIPMDMSTMGQILFTSSSNVIAGITKVNNAVVSTNGSGIPSESTTLPGGLTLPGATVTGDINTNSNINFTSLQYATGTMSQSGTTITGVGTTFTSAMTNGWIVPASGNAERFFYSGSPTIATGGLSQTISSGTAYTLYYYSSNGSIGNDQPAGSQIYANAGTINFGNTTSILNNLGLGVNRDLIASSSFDTGLASGPTTASQSGTTITGVGTNFTSALVGQIIIFASGKTAFITAVTNSTTATAVPSQTVASANFTTSGANSTAIDGAGDFGTKNAYVSSNLFLPSGYTLATNISGNAATVTTNANLTGDVTSSGNVTTYNNVVPLAKGGAAASLAGGSSGELLQRGASTIGYTTATYPTVATSTGSILRADGTNWLASTTTFPDTNAINTIPFASSANVFGSISPVNSAVLSTNGSGVPSESTTLPSGLAATNLSLTTPTLGVATATSVNKVAITAPATSATLTIANSGTLQLTGGNTLNLTTTGTTTPTFPIGTGNIAYQTTGTWTPGLSFGGGTTGLTYTEQKGYYDTTVYTNGTTKVCLGGDLVVNNKGSSTGAVLLTGLPVSSGSNGAAFYFSVSPGSISTGSGTYLFLQVQANSTTAKIDFTGNGLSFAQTVDTDFANGSVVAIPYTCYQNV